MIALFDGVLIEKFPYIFTVPTVERILEAVLTEKFPYVVSCVLIGREKLEDPSRVIDPVDARRIFDPEATEKEFREKFS